MGMSDRARELLSITARLIACMEAEVAMLRSMRTDQLQSIHGEKAALAELYEARLRELAQNPQELAAIVPALRQELVETNARFQQALAENARALRAVTEVSKRVVQAIAEAVEQQRGNPMAYTRSAGAPPRRAAAGAVAVALNQKA